MPHIIQRRPSGIQYRRAAAVAMVAMASTASWYAIAGHQASSVDDMSSCRVTVGEYSASYPVASTQEQKRRGLSNRNDIGPGMLFVWDEPVTPAVWMKDTRRALSVAFIDPGGTVIAIDSMEAGSLEHHVPPSPILAMIEVARGTFGARGVTVGDRVKADCLSFNTASRTAGPGTARGALNG